MATPLQQKLTDLLSKSPSYLSLDEQKQLELKTRLLALPEKEMADAIKIFETEQSELEEIKTLTANIKSSSKNLQKTFLKTQENDETHESNEESKNILEMLDS